MVIKHRIWSYSERKFLSSKEIYERKIDVIIPETKKKEKVSLTDAIIYFGIFGYELHPYIGHTDKDGRDIYLQDRIKVTSGDEVLCESAEVSYGWYQKHGEDPYLGYFLQGKVGHRDWESFAFARRPQFRAYQFEVIGNSKSKTPYSEPTMVNIPPAPEMSVAEIATPQPVIELSNNVETNPTFTIVHDSGVNYSVSI